MTDQSTAVSLAPQQGNDFAMSMFSTAANFELLQLQAQLISRSNLIPREFQGNVPNCAVALEMALRLGASVFPVMQNLDVIHGRPSWRAQFVIALVNSSGRFSSLEFEKKVTGPETTKEVEIEFWQKKPNSDQKEKKVKKINWKYTPTTCIAWATNKATGQRVEGPPVSYDLAFEEGWVSKDGSKWLTSMRELMLMYRAASWFGRIHCPDRLLGIQSTDEVEDTSPIRDVTPEKTEPEAPAETLEGALGKEAGVTEAQVDEVTPPPKAAAARGSRASAPAKQEPAPAPASKPAPANHRGRRVVFESVAAKSDVSKTSGKPYTKYTLAYNEGGTSKQADTFSDVMGPYMQRIPYEALIYVETSPNSNSRYADKLEFVEAEDESALNAPPPAETGEERDADGSYNF